MATDPNYLNTKIYVYGPHGRSDEGSFLGSFECHSIASMGDYASDELLIEDSTDGGIWLTRRDTGESSRIFRLTHEMKEMMGWNRADVFDYYATFDSNDLFNLTDAPSRNTRWGGGLTMSIDDLDCDWNSSSQKYVGYLYLYPRYWRWGIYDLNGFSATYPGFYYQIPSDKSGSVKRFTLQFYSNATRFKAIEFYHNNVRGNVHQMFYIGEDEAGVEVKTVAYTYNDYESTEGWTNDAYREIRIDKINTYVRWELGPLIHEQGYSDNIEWIGARSVYEGDTISSVDRLGFYAGSERSFYVTKNGLTCRQTGEQFNIFENLSTVANNPNILGIKLDENSEDYIPVGSSITINFNTDGYRNDAGVVFYIVATEEIVPTVKGRWTFNETINMVSDEIYAVHQSFDVDFAIPNSNGDEGFHIQFSNGELKLGIVGGDAKTVYADGIWQEESYRVIDFGTTEQEVTQEFYDWLIFNAMPGDFSDAYYMIKKQTLIDIANAIRSKTGGVDLICPEDFANEILSIPGYGYEIATDEDIDSIVDSTFP